MSVLIAHASISENSSVNGAKGDQTGKEVCIRTWYNKPWDTLIRFTDKKMAEKLAYCMEKACENNYIGYSQDSRNTLLKEARKYNYDVSKVNVPCNTDCSALVSVACMYAGISESTLTLNGNCATTRTLKNILKATGEVEIYTSPSYLNVTERLKRGDILLKQGSHVVVVVKTEGLKSVDEVAHEVLQGKWGRGAARKTKLEFAGYNYAEIQKRVNELLQAQYNQEPAKKVWDYLMTKIGNKYGVAGMMGNIKAESNMNPKNLQNSYEKKLGFNDDTYTVAVDSGQYKNFASDKAGYGLCQWTSSGRKQALYDFRGSRSIGDMMMQVEFLYYELTHSYKSVLEVLKNATSVREASDIVLKKFERPADQGIEAQERRARFSNEYLKKYGGN